MFHRFRTALAALISPTPAPGPADTDPAPNPGEQVPAPGPADIPHPDDYADRAAFYAAVLEAAARLRADEATSNTTGAVSDHGRALQARDVQDVHMDTHHHGGTVTNTTGDGATVGLQAGHVDGGVFHIGHNTGQVFKADRVDGGVNMGGGGVFNMGGHNQITGAAIGTGATVNNGVTVNGTGATVHTGTGDLNQNSTVNNY